GGTDLSTNYLIHPGDRIFIPFHSKADLKPTQESARDTSFSRDIRNIESRLNDMEKKLDRVLKALEKKSEEATKPAPEGKEEKSQRNGWSARHHAGPHLRERHRMIKSQSRRIRHTPGADADGFALLNNDRHTRHLRDARLRIRSRLGLSEAVQIDCT